MSPIFRPPLFYRDRQFDPFYVKPATQSNGESAVLNSPRRITYYALIIARAFSLSLRLYGALHMSSIPLDYGFPPPPESPIGCPWLASSISLSKGQDILITEGELSILCNNWGICWRGRGKRGRTVSNLQSVNIPRDLIKGVTKVGHVKKKKTAEWDLHLKEIPG